MSSHGPPDRTGVALWDFSPSRMAVASRCGLAFKYQYMDGIPAPFDRAASLFGNAIHDGLFEWYGPDDEPRDHQARDLAPIVLAQWERLLPPTIWTHVQEMRDLDEEFAAVCAAIQFKRPTLKAPHTTKEALESKAALALTAKRTTMLELCDALNEIKWPKDEDPYKAYVKSAAMAKRIQERWQHLPRPMAVERPFNIEFEGFRLRGRLDQFRVDPDRRTGEAFPLLLDVKTTRNLLTPMDAFLQAFMYFLACQEWDDLPKTQEFAFYNARKDRYQRGRIDPERHARLASRVLNGRARQIIMGQFEPSYGFWCERCDFKDLCVSELSLWDGEYGEWAELPEIAA